MINKIYLWFVFHKETHDLPMEITNGLLTIDITDGMLENSKTSKCYQQMDNSVDNIWR